MTQELFLKYIDRRCTSEEIKETEQWLRSCTNEELDLLLLQIWNDKNNPVMSAAQTQQLWKRLSQVTHQQEPKRNLVRMFFNRRMAVAAAVVAFAVLSMVWVFEKKRTSLMIAAVSRQQPVDISKNAYWSFASNAGSKQKSITLEDGSELILFPGSGLKYPAHFEKDRRDIFLDGKAMFMVAKDKQRPFTVYSHDMATTALGTKFLVDESDKKYSTVKLYEGKVVVKANNHNAGKWEDIFLLPGDVFTYDAQKRRVTVKQDQQVNEWNENTKVINKNLELNFTNAELADVFEVLKNKYKNEIIYNRTEISGMYFTGNISQTSSLAKVLKIIAQMNGLDIGEQNGKYIVQKRQKQP